MNTMNYAKAWKQLMEYTKLVKDPVLRKVMIAEFKKRTWKEWGFNPDTAHLNTKTDIILDSWEKELVSDIEDSISFGFNTRANEQKQTAKEAHARMMMFIEQGGRLEDIPEDIRSNTIDNLYHECLIEYGNQMIKQADSLIGAAQ